MQACSIQEDYYIRTPNQIIKGVLKISWKSPVMELLFSKFQTYKLQPLCVFLKFQKIPEIACAVEFLFTAAGAYRFSTSCSELLFEKLPSVLKKDFSMDVLLGSFQKYSQLIIFSETLMDGFFQKFKHLSRTSMDVFEWMGWKL